jgi:hypothetical protein
MIDRYWQIHLRAYRHAFMTSSLPTVKSEYSTALMNQIMVDIHPIFGAYILYMHALELRAGHELQVALDHLHFASEWLESWRVEGNALDLAQKVSDFTAWLMKMFLSLQQMKLKLKAEKESGTRCLKAIVPEDWMAELVADDVHISQLEGD